jgi:hypothetical protein
LRQKVSARPATLGIYYGQLKRDPYWEPLRKDPRYEKLLAQLAATDREAANYNSHQAHRVRRSAFVLVLEESGVWAAV